MSAQHTPGPWCCEHRKGSDSMYRTEVFSVEHGVIATCKWTPKNLGSGVTGTYREANARLIAAAPDLLEALELAHKALEAIANEMTVGERYTNAGQYLLDSLEPSRDAIAKATGQKGSYE